MRVRPHGVRQPHILLADFVQNMLKITLPENIFHGDIMMKRSTLFLVIALFALSLNAQEAKPKAVLFDTFEVRPENLATWEKDFDARIEKYAAALNAQKLKPYVISYSPRVYRPKDWYSQNTKDRLPGAADMNNSAAWRLNHDGFTWQELFGNSSAKPVEGGVREYSTTELWIVPPGAGPPAPTPTVSEAEAIVCPMVRVVAPWQFQVGRSLVEFTADHKGKLGPAAKFGFEWQVMNGEIVSGQGTSNIQVKPREGFLGKVTAGVRISGFNDFCPEADLIDKSETEIWKDKISYGEFGRSNLKAELDVLNNILGGDESLNGVFISYPEKKNGSLKLKAWVNRIRKAIAFRQFDASRFIFIEGGPRDRQTTEFWFIPKGGELPIPIPPAADPNSAKCPKIDITGPFLTPMPVGELEYRAAYNRRVFPNDSGFKWSVTDGEILSGNDAEGSFGQGTKRIRLKLKGDFRSAVNIGLEMKAGAKGCERLVASVSTMIGEERFEVSGYNQTFAEVSKDIKRFIDYLERDPSLVGYVINYGSPMQVRRREQMIYKLFPRSFSETYSGPRITFINGGYYKDSKDLITELWVSRPEVPGPPLHSEKE